MDFILNIFQAVVSTVCHDEMALLFKRCKVVGHRADEKLAVIQSRFIDQYGDAACFYWYNYKRIKQSVGWKSQAEYRTSQGLAVLGKQLQKNVRSPLSSSGYQKSVRQQNGSQIDQFRCQEVQQEPPILFRPHSADEPCELSSHVIEYACGFIDIRIRRMSGLVIHVPLQKQDSRGRHQCEYHRIQCQW